MNTIEYRVDCQLLQYLHEENNLGYRFVLTRVELFAVQSSRMQSGTVQVGAWVGRAWAASACLYARVRVPFPACIPFLHVRPHPPPRFPIGKTDQVKQWPQDLVHAFWKRWYFPANATLYVVGDFDRCVCDCVVCACGLMWRGGGAGDGKGLGRLCWACANQCAGALRLMPRSMPWGAPGRPLSEVQQLIEKEFGRVPPGTLPPAEAGAVANGSAANGSAANGGAANGNGHAAPPPAVPVSAAARQLQCHGSPPLPPAVAPLADAPAAAAAIAAEEAAAAGDAPVVKVRHPVRPPVAHKHGYGPMAPGEGPAAVSVFRHPLLQTFMLSVFCKLPVMSMTTMEDLRKVFMVRILLSAFTFRVNARYVDANPRFSEIGLDISDSGREGCAVSTLTITAEPKGARAAPPRAAAPPRFCWRSLMASARSARRSWLPSLRRPLLDQLTRRARASHAHRRLARRDPRGGGGGAAHAALRYHQGRARALAPGAEPTRPPRARGSRTQHSTCGGVRMCLCVRTLADAQTN